MPQASTIGERVMLARMRKDLQQKELAVLAGIAPNTISQLEHGRQRQLSSNALRRLARALGVTADFLLGLDLEEKDVIERVRHGESVEPGK